MSGQVLAKQAAHVQDWLMFNKLERDEILNDAQTALAARGIVIKVSGLGDDPTITLKAGNCGTKKYELQVVGRMTPGAARVLTPSAKGDLLVLAPHVTEASAEIFDRTGVDYLDRAGNALLRWERMLVDVRGRRRMDLPNSPASQSRLFSASGVRVIFALLSWPSLVNRPLREIAHVAKTSLGTAQATISGLKNAGYIFAPGSGEHSLIRTRELLDRWVEAYSIRLEPKLGKGYFASTLPDWWMGADFNPGDFGVQVGGEAAAWMMDGFLKPTTCTLYSDDLPLDLIKARRLHRVDPHDPMAVAMRQKFWRDPDFPGISLDSPVVPAPLIYADLLVSGEPRQREAAAKLRKEHDELRRLDRS